MTTIPYKQVEKKEVFYDLDDVERKHPIVFYNITDEISPQERMAGAKHYKFVSGRIHWNPIGKGKSMPSFHDSTPGRL